MLFTMLLFIYIAPVDDPRVLAKQSVKGVGEIAQKLV